ncbi:MAG: hypothetical protein MUC66_01970 [Methanolinea sp.]|nr:hypothetical protein [Methanolinea sp.]
MKRVRWRMPLFLALILAGCILAGGCLSVLSQAGPGETVSDGDSAALMATLVDQDADWGFARGCTWTATFQVSNPGSTTEKNARLHVELVNARTGAVRDAKDLFLGPIGPGEEKSVRVVLDGECLDEYTVRAIPVISGP